MLNVTASLSKKVPIVGRDYSSQSFGATVSAELSDKASDAELRDRIQQIYRLVEQVVDSEIARAEAAQPQQPAAQPTVPQPQSKANGNGQANGNGGRATQAQIKALFAISRAKNISRDDLLARIVRAFNIPTPDQLSISQASTMIQNLKAS